MPLRPFLRLLTLLLGIFYLDTVCQTDAEDARAYYASGIQEHVAAPDAVAVATPVARPMTPTRRHHRAGGRRPQTRWRRRLAALASPYPLLPPAPARRWLRCGVIQV